MHSLATVDMYLKDSDFQWMQEVLSHIHVTELSQERGRVEEEVIQGNTKELDIHLNTAFFHA